MGRKSENDCWRYCVAEFSIQRFVWRKLRPVVVLAVIDRDDFVVCQITSQRKADRAAIELTSSGFAEGGLRVTSFVRPGKLFTAHSRLSVKRIGRLTDLQRDRIREAVVQLIRKG